MKFKYKTILIFLFFGFISKNSKAQKCNCDSVLKEVISITEDSYSGFNDRTLVDKEAYNTFKDLLLKNKQNETLDYSCFQKIKKYVKFFNDNHFSISFNNKQYPNDVKDFFNIKFPSINFIAERKIIYPNIEGEWIDDLKRYSIKITNVGKNKLIGYITKGNDVFWSNNQIKVELIKKKNKWKAIYFLRDHTPVEEDLIVENDFLKIGDYVRYKRLGNIDSLDKSDFLFTKLNHKFNYYKISNFALENAKQIDSITESNWESIRKTDNLIIDLRNNYGGSKLGFLKILPLLGKDSFATYGTSWQASQLNIDTIKGFVSDTLMPQSFRDGFARIANLMEKNKNQLVSSSKNGYDDIDTSYNFPKKIFILVNGKTASAAEMLVRYAKQSDKVTVLGTPTFGVQYYSTVNSIKLKSCKILILNSPMSRSNAIDEIKSTKSIIKPTVNITLPDSKWVDFILNKYSD